MKVTIVDFYTVSYGDLDVTALKSLGDVRFFGALCTEEIIAAAEDSEAIIVNKADVNRRVVEGCKKLKYVGTFSTGFNNIDIAACRERGITVCNVPDYSADAVSQHVFALLLNFAGKTDKFIASVAGGEWEKSPNFCYVPWQTAEVAGKTFGVYGYGSIGRKVARIADAFGMKVIVHSKRLHDDCPYPQVSADELFANSDYLSLHCPLNGETAGTVNKRTLSLMKNSAVLINTARGGLIDEQALVDALNSGRIGGACLDTLTAEPPTGGNVLIGAKNCLITPHIAWVPQETRQRLVEIAARNLQAFAEGKPQNVVSRQ